MSRQFLDRLCAAVLDPSVLSTNMHRSLISRAMADTLAVAAAGFQEDVTRNVLSAYAGDGPKSWSGQTCESGEAAVLVNAVAAHALDFDDVYIESMAHISTVLMPVVFRSENDDPAAVMSAFAAGLIAAKAIARRVGRGHYQKGWHGTGTIGAFAAAAAAGRLLQLDEIGLANAFALAASMSGGLQVNFSTQAKPVHAGFAAVAGIRAAKLAKAGVTGSRDIFSGHGYPHLYGIGDGEETPGEDAFVLRPDLISVKLFPCCFAASRLVGIALDAREKIGQPPPGSTFTVTVPAGSIAVLKYDRPVDGLQAKFSAHFPIAVALLDGTPTLASFSDEATGRADIRALMERIEVVEDPAQQSQGNIEFGEVRLTMRDPAGADLEFHRKTLPGAPDDPPSQAALKAKIEACLDVFNAAHGASFPAMAWAAGLGVAAWH